MFRDRAHRFLVWVQCGQCLLFSCLSACTLDRAGFQAALQWTDSPAAQMPDAAEMPVGDAEMPDADTCHDASLIDGDASVWPVSDAGVPAAEPAGPELDAGQPASDAGADASVPDLCPNDAAKIGDVDSDGDGVLDCNDECPLDAQKTEEGLCGCGNAEPDDSKRPRGRRGATCPMG